MDGMYPGFGSPINVPQAPKKGGMFGAGGPDWASALQALIGGALATRGNPGGAFLLKMLNDRREKALEEDKYQRHRKDNLADYAEQQKLQQQYGAPAQPHYFEDNGGNQWAIGADGVPKMVHKDDLPFKLVPNGLGGVVPVDLRTLMAGQGDEILDELPPGAKPLGGPTPQASGGFPRY